MSLHKSLKNPTNKPLVIKVKANTNDSAILRNPGHPTVFSMPVVIKHKALSKMSPKLTSKASRSVGGRKRKTMRKHGKKTSKMLKHSKATKKRSTLKRSKKHEK